MQTRRKYTEEERQQHLAAYRSSGTGIIAYCRRQSIPYHTFLNWLKPKKRAALGKNKMEVQAGVFVPVEVKREGAVERKLFASLKMARVILDLYEPVPVSYLQNLIKACN